MDIRITPSFLSGKINAVSSKSHTHRLLISSFLSGEPMGLDGLTVSKDIEATFECLKSIKNGNNILNCKESGSTLRFLLPVAAALGIKATFIGEGRLPERPLSPFIEELSKNGAVFSNKALPIKLSGKLQSGDFNLPGDISSQFISGLLFALPILEGESRIIIKGKMQSSAYVDLTIDTLKAFGIDIEKTDFGFFIKGNQKYIKPSEILVQGDWSNAAFFLCMGALNADINLSGLSFNVSQCDKEIFTILKDNFGADISVRDSINVRSNGSLKPVSLDVSQFPDLFPVLAVTACGARGKTLLYNAARLRIKESDRIKATANLINSLGGCAIEHSDSLEIIGSGSLSGGTVSSFNDHRIAMAAAVASCICKDEVIIKDAQAVEKSYPSFFEDFISLGGKAHVI